MRNVPHKVVEKIKTRIVLNKFFSENEVMWKNIVQPERPQMKVYRCVEKMRFSCWITKATDTLS
jgi:hypothetical protein